MRQGRPRKLNKPVTICVVLEQEKLNELDNLRAQFSRGEYINIMTISDNLKTQKILELKEELKKKEEKIKKLSDPKNISSIIGFQKTIYSHFKIQFKQKLDEMPKHAKSFLAEKIGCSIQELENYL